jgi:hypothetical protein
VQQTADITSIKQEEATNDRKVSIISVESRTHIALRAVNIDTANVSNADRVRERVGIGGSGVGEEEKKA